jgi:hypothetical protein
MVSRETRGRMAIGTGHYSPLRASFSKAVSSPLGVSGRPRGLPTSWKPVGRAAPATGAAASPVSPSASSGTHAQVRPVPCACRGPRPLNPLEINPGAAAPSRSPQEVGGMDERLERDAEMLRDLSPTRKLAIMHGPIRDPKLQPEWPGTPGVNHFDAIRAPDRAGLVIPRESRRLFMSDGLGNGVPTGVGGRFPS